MPAPTPIIVATASGLGASDFGFRIYEDDASDTATADALTVAEPETRRYAVSGVPAPKVNGAIITVTAQYSGVTFSFVYRNPETTAPAVVVVPIRVAGLDENTLGLKLFKNGESQSVTWSVEEIGSPGDYAVSGWPDDPGNWELQYSYAGIISRRTWTVAALPTSRPSGVVGRLLSRKGEVLSWQKYSLAKNKAAGTTTTAASGDPVDALTAIIPIAAKESEDLKRGDSVVYADASPFPEDPTEDWRITVSGDDHAVSGPITAQRTRPSGPTSYYTAYLRTGASSGL